MLIRLRCTPHYLTCTVIRRLIAKMTPPCDNVERKLKHLFDGSDWNVYESQILNFGVGAPGPDLLQNCCEIFSKATEHRLRYEREQNNSLLFQYGPTSGTYEARHAIAMYFSEKYGTDVKSEDLIITTGATQGFHFILSTLLDLNGYIFVDEVTYMIALDVMKQFSTLQIVPIRLKDDGVDLEHFESVLKDRRFMANTKPCWGMYYAIPTFHNPTGILFSKAVCRGLIQLARKYDLLILCDDVYNILQYGVDGAALPKRLFAYDEHGDANYAGHVISNGSLSKIIGPGVRLGWLEVPARFKITLDGSGIVNSGGCFNNYTAGIVASLFELGLAQQHIQLVYNAYRDRMLSACNVLALRLPAGCHMLTPTGGYFIWVRLPEDTDAGAFQQFCLAKEKIFFIPGARFALQPHVGRNCLRLSIAFHGIDKLVDGIERLCAALQTFLTI